MRGDVVRGSAIVFAGMALAACSAGSYVAMHGASAGSTEMPRLDGVYKATVIAPMLGPVQARITAEPTRDGFKANTRPGVAWTMIGGIEGALGQIFAPFLFPGGVILTWESLVPGNGVAGEGWISAGQVKNARMRTQITSAARPIELYTRDGRRIGLITLEPAEPDGPPFADYPALADNIESVLKDRLYDPALADSAQVRGYMRQVRRAAEMSTDDVEFIFGAGAAAYQNIRFPWPMVAKRDVPSLRPRGWSSKDLGTIRVHPPEDNGIVSIMVEAFLEAEDVDRVFEELIAADPIALKLDLLRCPGVTMASLRVASWLIDEPVHAGTFFTAAHREASIAGDTSAFPTVSITSAQSVKAAEAALERYGAVNVVIHPAPVRYDGPVAVLTTDKTTTSAESLVWVLKNHSHARVHGSPTAGKPQISLPIDIGQGWVLWLAAADWRPPTGERVDRGIRPDFPDRNRDRAKAAADRRLLAEAAERPQRAALPAQPGAAPSQEN